MLPPPRRSGERIERILNDPKINTSATAAPAPLLVLLLPPPPRRWMGRRGNQRSSMVADLVSRRAGYGASASCIVINRDRSQRGARIKGNEDLD